MQGYLDRCRLAFYVWWHYMLIFRLVYIVGDDVQVHGFFHLGMSLKPSSWPPTTNGRSSTTVFS